MNRIRALRDDLQLSQDKLASLAEVSRHSIIRMEQLCYPNPLPNVVMALSDLTGVSEKDIETQYYEAVLTNRVRTGLLLVPHHDLLLKLTHQLIVSCSISGGIPDVHLFTIWRSAIADLLRVSSSQIHFSMMTSIHPATLFKYEAFKTGFPDPIKVALEQMNLPLEQITLFETSEVFNWIKR